MERKEKKRAAEVYADQLHRIAPLQTTVHMYSLLYCTCHNNNKSSQRHVLRTAVLAKSCTFGTLKGVGCVFFCRNCITQR